MNGSIAVCERDVDFLLLEELQCNPQFRRWLLDRLGTGPDASIDIIRLARSVFTFRGETDLLFVHKDFDDATRAVMVENKIDAIFTPNQAQRYQARGEDGIRRGEWSRYVVALLGPQKRIDAPDAGLFANRISYEDIAEQLAGSDSRTAFKKSILLNACATASTPWTQVVDPQVSEWFRQVRMFSAKEYPDLPLPVERDRAPTNVWIIFTPKGYAPARVSIEIKPVMGAVDLRFKGVELGDLRRTLQGALVVPMETMAATKSCSIRLAYPPLNARGDLSTQEPLLRSILSGALDLMRFSQTHKPAIDQLLEST